jgi:hypothetical protein
MSDPTGGELSPGTAPSSSPSPAPSAPSSPATPPERKSSTPNPRANARRPHWSDGRTQESQWLEGERARRAAAAEPPSPGTTGRDTPPGAAPGEQPTPAAEIGPITRTENGRYKFSDDLELSEDDVRGLMERHALEENRKATLPADPSAYEAKLPGDFVVPQGIEFQLDENHPLMPQARQLAHDIDAGKIGGQEALSRMLAMNGASEIARVQQFDRQVQAEVQKLGATGTLRVTTIQNFIKSIAPEDTCATCTRV